MVACIIDLSPAVKLRLKVLVASAEPPRTRLAQPSSQTILCPGIDFTQGQSPAFFE
jgi:hypothetical protein